MLKRARTWLVIALVAALFGFTGILQSTAMIAQDLFYLCSAFAVLSVLLSLFEGQAEARSLSEEAPQPSALPVDQFVRPTQPNHQATSSVA
jgi:uncharacterized membrane protein YtjA (UPF0391 family)